MQSIAGYTIRLTVSYPNILHRTTDANVPIYLRRSVQDRLRGYAECLRIRDQATFRVSGQTGEDTRGRSELLNW